MQDRKGELSPELCFVDYAGGGLVTPMLIGTTSVKRIRTWIQRKLGW